MQTSLTQIENSLYNAIVLLDERGTNDSVTKALIICETIFSSASKGKVLSPADTLTKANKTFASLKRRELAD